MPDLDQLRDLADQVRPPAFGALTETARRRDRRAAAGLATALVVLAVVVLSGIVTTRDERTSPQPARPSPSTDVRAAGMLPSRPAWKSSIAWMSSSLVFITNGP